MKHISGTSSQLQADPKAIGDFMVLARITILMNVFTNSLDCCFHGVAPILNKYFALD